jgi:hypothetical protein
MSNQPDLQLQDLFAQAAEPLGGDELCNRVMAAARKRKWLAWSGLAAAALLTVVVGWQLLAVSLLEFAVIVSGTLTTNLVDLGEGWLALILLPVNSIGGLLAIAVRAAQLIRRRMVGGFA